ncbi:MAG: Pvc16 family protein, partial [Mangrovicoccus sp.]
MAGFSAPYAVGESLVQHLRNIYPDDLRQDHPCRFELAKSADFADPDTFAETTVSFFLYRMTIDQYLHPAGSDRSLPPVARALPLDLHYMVTVWSDNRHTEQLL